MTMVQIGENGWFYTPDTRHPIPDTQHLTSTMLTVIRKRLLLAIPTLIGVTFITFFAGFLAPGSPIDAKLKERNDPAARARLMHEYGLDRPPLVQYVSFLLNAARGDWENPFLMIHLSHRL